MPVLGIVLQGHHRGGGLEGELWAVGFFCQGGMSEEQRVKAAPQKEPPAHPAVPAPFSDTAVQDEVPVSPGAGRGTDPQYTNLHFQPSPLSFSLQNTPGVRQAWTDQGKSHPGLLLPLPPSITSRTTSRQEPQVRLCCLAQLGSVEWDLSGNFPPPSSRFSLFLH